MFINRSDGFIILHNPRCGVINFAWWIRSALHPDATPMMTAHEARKLMPADEWKQFKVIVPVRDPVARFLSAVEEIQRQTAAETIAEDDFTLPEGPGAYAEAAERLANLKPADWPRLFWPQARWLDIKVDIILPLHSFAAFANAAQNGQSLSARTPYDWKMPVRATPEVEAAVQKLYDEDYALFDTLPVWPSDDEHIYKLAGACPACDAKRNAERAKEKAAQEAAEKEAGVVNEAPKPDANFAPVKVAARNKVRRGV